MLITIDIQSLLFKFYFVFLLNGKVNRRIEKGEILAGYWPSVKLAEKFINRLKYKLSIEPVQTWSTPPYD